MFTQNSEIATWIEKYYLMWGEIETSKVRLIWTSENSETLIKSCLMEMTFGMVSKR